MHVPRQVRVLRAYDGGRGGLDPRALRRRGEGARRRPEPHPAHEAALRLAARARRHQRHRRPRRALRGQRDAEHRRPRSAQGLRALGAPAEAATACSPTRRRRSPIRSCATAARSPGSLAHADPQGDWGSALLAAGAQVQAQGPSGTRTIPLDDFFHGPFTTALEPTEIVTWVQVPDPGPERGRYLKLERKVGDFATVSRRRPRLVLERKRRARRHRPHGRGPAQHARRKPPRRRSPGASSTTRRSPRLPGLQPRPRSRATTSAAAPSTSATSSGCSPSAALRKAAARGGRRR